jgi:RNA polymerase sigma-70 factor, ECF subfamily
MVSGVSVRRRPSRPYIFSRGARSRTRMQHRDQDLVRRLRAGDESAFEGFFAEYFPRVYRFARVRLGGDDDAAEEVAQMTLIKALAKVGTYRGEAPLFTWLCSFCRHEIVTWLERTGKAARVPVADDPADTRAVLDAIAVLSGDDPEREYERHELSRLVHATLDHLPGKYGQALVWKYIEGTPVEEIGRRLGLGYKAAESLLTRARQAFRVGFALAAAGQLRPPSVISDSGSSNG